MTKTRTFLIIATVSMVIGIVAGKLTGRNRDPQLLCLDNLKRVGQASLQYAEDNNGFLPDIASATVKSNLNGNWYVGDEKLWISKLQPYSDSKDIWYCPQDHKQYQFVMLPPKTFGTANGWFKLNIHKAPSNLIWLTDAVDRGGDNPVTAHRRVCNALRVDGNVKTLTDN